MKLREVEIEWQHYFVDKHGRKQGEYKEWHDNDQIRVIGHYRDGKLHGEYKSWHDNGQLRIIVYYKDNYLHGEAKSWYENGQLCKKAYWKEGKFHGEYKRWYSSGELCRHTFDIDGKEIIDFLMNPELYPTTPEEKTMFALKHGSAPFIGEDK